MTTIYVVTRGQYSDYGISAIFDSKEKADDYIRASDYDTNQLEEYELNPAFDAPPPGVEAFQCYLRYNGDISVCKADYQAYLNKPREASAGFPYGYPFKLRDYYPALGPVYVLAENEKHAQKIGAEKRAQMIALNVWPVVEEADMPPAKKTAGSYSDLPRNKVVTNIP